MIFVAFGNSPCQFKRLASAMDSYAKDNPNVCVLIQLGHTKYTFYRPNVTAVQFLSHEEFTERLKECDIAILQGGWGGMAEASKLNCRIIAVPRIEGPEHYHDQSQLVKALEKEGVLIGCYDIADLPMMIEKSMCFEFKQIEFGDSSEIINKFILDY